MAKNEQDQDKPKKYSGNNIGTEHYTPESGYIVFERGKKIQKWIDLEGNWKQKEI